jgi:hypothetical protein
MQHYSPEFGLSPLFSLDASTVELWYSQRDFVTHVLIQNAHQTYREGCEGQIDEEDIGVVV